MGRLLQITPESVSLSKLTLSESESLCPPEELWWLDASLTLCSLDVLCKGGAGCWMLTAQAKHTECEQGRSMGLVKSLLQTGHFNSSSMENASCFANAPMLNPRAPKSTPASFACRRQNEQKSPHACALITGQRASKHGRRSFRKELCFGFAIGEFGIMAPRSPHGGGCIKCATEREKYKVGVGLHVLLVLKRK